MPKVLLVEDNLVYRQLIKETLQTAFPGLEIAEAGDTAEGLQQMETGIPNLIFMDIGLPGENGLSLARRIKAERPEIRLVILTSYDLPEYRDAAREAQVDGFLMKGASAGEILAVTGSLLSLGGLCAAGRGAGVLPLARAQHP